MKLATLSAAAVSSLIAITAFAADFTLRPGRWEVTLLEMRLPGQARTEPDEEPTVDCLTENVNLSEHFTSWLAEDSEVRNYRQDGDTIQFTVTSDDLVFDYRFVRHSKDSYSATGISRGEDANQRWTFKYTARRTGAACSAQELAKSNARES